MLAVAFTAGWKYRLVAPVFAVALLFETTYHDAFGQLFHTENLMVLFVLVLAVAPRGDAYAFDRPRHQPQPAPQYGWPLVLLSVLTVITYFLAGWAKIANGGMGWLKGDVLLNQIAFDNVRKAVMGDPYSALGGVDGRPRVAVPADRRRRCDRRARRAGRLARWAWAQRLGDRRVAVPCRNGSGHVHRVSLPPLRDRSRPSTRSSASRCGSLRTHRPAFVPRRPEPYDPTVRRPSITPQLYRRFTLGALLLLAAIVVSGAAVRLTGSGLGCPDWPNCDDGRLVAPFEKQAMIEFTNRTITGLVSVAVILAVLGSVWRVPRRSDLVWLSWGLSPESLPRSCWVASPCSSTCHRPS